MIRQLSEDDVLKINDWRVIHGSHRVPVKAMPATTYIVSNERTDLLSFSIYMTNSAVLFLENFTSNPEAKRTEIHQAFVDAFDFIRKFSVEFGFQVLWGFVASRGIIRLAKRLGFYEAPNEHKLVMGYV